MWKGDFCFGRLLSAFSFSPILTEIMDVLNRPELTKKFCRLGEDEYGHSPEPVGKC